MTSTVPAAVAALVELCRSAVTQADVFDGPPLGGDYGDWIGIAYDPAGGDVVSTDTDFATLGTRSRDESYDIVCSIGSDSGDEIIATRRARCYTLLDAVAAALGDDYSLGGAVRVAHISSHSLSADLDDQGLTVGVRFIVHVDARI